MLLELFIRLVQSQAGQTIKPGEAWLNDAQTLSIKLFRHIESMQTISAGAAVEQNAIPTVFFVDHASVKVIAWAALETYLVFFYLYGGLERSLSEFRHKTWQLGGLVDRQLFHASTDEHREVLAKEKQQIDAVKFQIAKDPQLRTYTPKQRARLLDGDWRVGNGWSDLSVQAGFHEKYFKNIYGYLCGYSHSSYLSALQAGEAQTIEEQKKLTEFILGIGIVIMAQFSSSYSGAFKSASAVLDGAAEAKHVAEKWRFGPREMAAIYDR